MTMSNGKDQYQYVKLPDGSYGKFSSSATDAQIRATVQKDFPDAYKPKTLPVSPTAVSARPSGAREFLQNVEGDVRSGSDVTVIGKILKMMGAQGLQQGSQAKAGEFMGSPVLGAVHAAQGVSDIPSKGIVAGGKEALGGVMEAGTIPAMMSGGELIEGIPQTLKSAGNILKEGFTAGKESLAAYRTGKKAAKSIGEWKKINQALGVPQSAVRLSEKAGSLEEAATMPGRTFERLGFKAQELAKMDPIERMKLIQPFLKEAGENINNALIEAGKEGKTVDVGKSAFELFKKIPKKDQEKAIDMFNEMAEELDIVDQRKVTPIDAWRFKKQLSYGSNFDAGGRWSSLAAIRADLQRAVGNDLEASVPQMKELDQIFSDLKEGSKASRIAVKKEAVKPKPGVLKTMKEAAKKEIAERPIRSLGIAAGVPYLGYEAGKKASSMIP